MKYDQKYYTLTKSSPWGSQIHQWRFGEGMAAFEDQHLYVRKVPKILMVQIPA